MKSTVLGTGQVGARQRRGGVRRMLAGSLVLLGLAWFVSPIGKTPPLYDGVGFPDEPYRYVVPSSGATAARPLAAADTEPARGHVIDLLPVSGESGPQVQLDIPGGRLVIPAQATRVTGRAVPVAPTAPLPPDGTVWGNVYRITVTSPQGPVRLASGGARGDIELRAPNAKQPPPVMEVRSAGAWRRLPTRRVGNDIYGSALPVLGDYALVRLTAQSSHAVPGHHWSPVPVVIGGLIAVLAAAVAAVRISRRHAPADPDD